MVPNLRCRGGGWGSVVGEGGEGLRSQGVRRAAPPARPDNIVYNILYNMLYNIVRNILYDHIYIYYKYMLYNILNGI